MRFLFLLIVIFMLIPVSLAQEPSTPTQLLSVAGDGRTTLVFNSTGTRLAATGLDGIHVWEIPSGREIGAITDKGPITGTSFVPDDKQLYITQGPYGDVMLWHPDSGNKTTAFKSSLDFTTIFQTRINRPKNVIIHADSFDRVWVWDFWSGESLAQFDGNAGLPITIESEGNYFASGSEGSGSYDPNVVYSHDVYLWETQTGNKLHNLSGHSGNLHANGLDFNGDSTVLASAAEDLNYGDEKSDNSVRLWDVQSGDELLTLTGYGPVKFAPTNSILAYMAEPNRISLFDTTTETEVASINLGTDWLSNIAFSPQGGYFATANYNNEIVVWQLPEAIYGFGNGSAPPTIVPTEISLDPTHTHISDAPTLAPTAVSNLPTATPTGLSVSFSDDFDGVLSTEWAIDGNPPIVEDGQLAFIGQNKWDYLFRSNLFAAGGVKWDFQIDNSITQFALQNFTDPHYRVGRLPSLTLGM
jgi:WD40 repeat protein